MSKKYWFIVCSGVSFLAFIVFSYFVQKKYFLHLDFDTTVKLQNHIPRRLDSVFSTFSLAGSFEIATTILLLLLFIYRKKSIFFVYPFFAAMHLFEVFGKVFVNHPSPPHMFLRTLYPFPFPSGAAQLNSSYPSGHSARALFMTTVAALIIYRSKKLSPMQKTLCFGVCLLYDVVMLTSRVYLGEHWTSDVIGGSILGIASALLSFVLF